MKKRLCVFLLLLLFGLTPITTTSAFASEITEFEYDANNKLVKATSNETHTKYEYDKNGNMIGKKIVKNAVSIPKNLVRNPYFKETMETGEARNWRTEAWGAASSSFSIVKSENNNLQKLTGEGIGNNGIVGVSQIIDVAADREFVTNATLTVEQLNHAKVQLYIDSLEQMEAMLEQTLQSGINLQTVDSLLCQIMAAFLIQPKKQSCTLYCVQPMIRVQESLM